VREANNDTSPIRKNYFKTIRFLPEGYECFTTEKPGSSVPIWNPEKILTAFSSFGSIGVTLIRTNIVIAKKTSIKRNGGGRDQENLDRGV